MGIKVVFLVIIWGTGNRELHNRKKILFYREKRNTMEILLETREHGIPLGGPLFSAFDILMKHTKLSGVSYSSVVSRPSR